MKLFKILIFMMYILTVSSCSDSSENSSEFEGAKDLKNINIFPNNLSVVVGTEFALNAKSQDDEGSSFVVTEKVIWYLDENSTLEQSQEHPWIFKALSTGTIDVFAYNAYGILSKATITVFEQVEEVPPVEVVNPSGLTATSNSVNSIDLAWTNAIGITKTRIAYLEGTLAPSSCETGNIISSNLIGLNSDYTVSGLNINTNYSFRICSENNDSLLSSGIVVSHSTADYHKVFITNGTWNGLAVGGLDGADEKCQLEAELYGLTGNWKAILSGSGAGESALARLIVNRPIFNTRPANLGGPQLVAFNSAGLWQGNITSPINYLADGTLSAITVVWTGTSTAGSYSGANCANWTSTAGSGGRGASNSITGTWVTNATGTCVTVQKLYCIDGQ